MGERTAGTEPTTAYDERLGVPLWWWPFAAVVVALLGAEIHVGLPLVWKVVTYAVIGGLVASWLLSVGRARVRVQNGELIAGSAHVPLAVTGEVRALDAATTRRLLGPDADPSAYVLLRPWLRTAVYVELHDAADPTPYWLVCTRRPEQLAAALAGARAAAVAG